MKKIIFPIIFTVLFLSACGTSPSSDLFVLETDINEFKKSDNYEKFWDTINFLKKYKAELVNEDFVIAKKQDITNFLTVMGMSASECSGNLTTLTLKAKNKKVQNHLFNRASLYLKAGVFWAEDWDQYLSGESKLPNFAQLIDETIKQKEYYEDEYLKLKSET